MYQIKIMYVVRTYLGKCQEMRGTWSRICRRLLWWPSGFWSLHVQTPAEFRGGRSYSILRDEPWCEQLGQRIFKQQNSFWNWQKSTVSTKAAVVSLFCFAVLRVKGPEKRKQGSLDKTECVCRPIELCRKNYPYLHSVPNQNYFASTFTTCLHTMAHKYIHGNCYC